MSAYLPFHIQTEIIKRLALKPMARFKTVSKDWKHHIDTITAPRLDHHSDFLQARHVLIVGPRGSGKKTSFKRNLNCMPAAGGALGGVYGCKLPTGNTYLSCLITWDIQDYLLPWMWMNAQCAVIMFDVTHRPDFYRIKDWFRHIRRIRDDIPIVVCGNKVDADGYKKSTKVTSKLIEILGNCPYFEMSARANYNIRRLFLFLDPQIDTPELVPFARPDPDVQVDLVAQARREAEITGYSSL